MMSSSRKGPKPMKLTDSFSTSERLRLSESVSFPRPERCIDDHVHHRAYALELDAVAHADVVGLELQVDGLAVCFAGMLFAIVDAGDGRIADFPRLGDIPARPTAPFLRLRTFLAAAEVFLDQDGALSAALRLRRGEAKVEKKNRC